MLGIFDSSFGHPPQNLENSSHGFYLLLITLFLISWKECICIPVWLRVFFFFHTTPFLAGKVSNHNQSSIPHNEEVNEGDEWAMELDLRTCEKEKRTLHWFVRGKQQRVFIKGVPDRLEFIV